VSCWPERKGENEPLFKIDGNGLEERTMSLWIIKGSDFVDALKRAFEEQDKATLDHFMTEFNIADHGVTKRQKIKFIDGLARQRIAPKTARLSGHRPVLKVCKQNSHVHSN
jgi:hypothetical protein